MADGTGEHADLRLARATSRADTVRGNFVGRPGMGWGQVLAAGPGVVGPECESDRYGTGDRLACFGLQHLYAGPAVLGRRIMVVDDSEIADDTARPRLLGLRDDGGADQYARTGVEPPWCT